MPKYDASAIQVITLREAVRRRPGMYVGDTQDGSGLHNMLRGVFDNGIDEHLEGHATYVRVAFNGDSVSVEDDGRGIAVSPETDAIHSALELALTTLRSGGRSLSRRVCPLGMDLAVVNALSSRLDAEIWLDGRRYLQSCAAGVALGPVRDLGPTDRRGTRISFTPDFTIFRRRLVL